MKELKKVTAGVLMAAGALLSAPANALLLPYSGPAGNINLATGTPPGVLVASNTSATTAPGYTGTTYARVVDGPESGVNLDFYFQFSGAVGNPQALQPNFTLQTAATNGLAPMSFDVLLPGFTLGSGSQRILGQVSSFGVFMSGNMGSALDYLLVVRTTATAFDANAFGVSASGLAGELPAGSTVQSPLASSTPEPGTMALLATGLLALVGFRRRHGFPV